MAQKICFILAILCYGVSLTSIAVSFYFYRELGGQSPIVASMGASVVFFLGTGIVLHVIGRSNLPDLRIRR